MNERGFQSILIELILEYLGSTNDVNESVSDSLDQRTATALVNFIDEIPGGFLIYRAYGDEEIIYANKALIKIFKCRSLQEFRKHTGNSFKGIVHPVDLEAVENSIARQIAQNKDKMDYVEYRIRRRDGAVRWVQDYGHFVQSEAVGGIFYVFISDVTEERNRRMEETAALISEKDHKIQTLIEEYDKERKLINQEHLRRLEVIEGLSVNYDTILYVDIDTDKMLPYRVSRRVESEFEETNQPRAFKSYVKGYAAEWVYPDDMETFLRATDRAYIKRKLSDNKTFFTNYRIVEGGAIYHMQLRVVNVGSEKHISQIVIGSRNIEEEIRRDLNRMKVLEEALNNAKSANVAKNTFLSNMSHDMRTPLNAVFGYTALAKHGADAKTREYLDKIDASGQQLLELIDKVLAISQIESSETEIVGAEYNIGQIARKAYDYALTLAGDKRLNVTCDVSKITNLDVICDGDKLEQSLFHIVSNAVKYTENGGSVAIAAVETQRLPNGYSVYELSVTDNGVGINKDSLEHIFEPFERIRNTTFSGVFGTGLGLTITKRYIDAMGGRIAVESDEGKGSRFTVTLNLPTVETGERLAFTAEELVREFNGRKILLVDDNEINLEIEREILEDIGFVIDTAMNGRQAVDRITECRADEYALILMDIQMPVMDGRQATKEIRGLPDKSKASVPVIALSANAFESDRKLSLEYGLDEHLTKPLDIPNLLKTVSLVLRSRGK